MAAIDRRTILGGAIGLASTSLIWAGVARAEPHGQPATNITLISRVCDLVIPRTATPGAVDAKVPAFVALALKHGMEGTLNPHADGAPPNNDYVAWLRAALGSDFLGLSHIAQAVRLTKLDAAAYAADAKPSPWRALKATILAGYFTSEAGGSKTLRYEPLPGRFDPNVPIAPKMTSISNDWTAVDFG